MATSSCMGTEDMEVDVVTGNRIRETCLNQKEDPDVTEYSSSFEDTDSDTQRCSVYNEGEVETQFYCDSDFPSPFVSFHNLFHKRKKLTDHWRNFIRPLMWRCKWTELKIKEIESQARKYDREIVAYEQGNYSRIYPNTYEGFCSRLLPYSSKSYRRKAAKRRKRKKVEDSNDIVAYMSQHSLFSYLENRNCRFDGTIPGVDDFGNTVIKDENGDCNEELDFNHNQLFDSKEGPTSLEKVLWRIEALQFHIHKLKDQLDFVMSKHGTKFSSSENVSLLAAYDAQISTTPSPTTSACNGEATSSHLGVHENVGSSYGKPDAHVPDVIESTIGLLSSVDVSFHGPQVRDSHEYIVDNVMMMMQKEMAQGGENQEFVEHNNQEMASSDGGGGEDGGGGGAEAIQQQQISEFDGAANGSSSSSRLEPLILKSQFASHFRFPRSKRKRGRRKIAELWQN